jgi:hypothetical protein
LARRASEQKNIEMDAPTFIIDDLSAARKFISTLNRKIVRQRFSNYQEWNPDHIVLAIKNGKVVAMADCVLSDNKNGANGSLLARPEFGGHSIVALTKLKQLVKVDFWQSTLRSPTDATCAISRRFFDVTHDQGAWEISNALVRMHGVHSHLHPTPLVASNSFLKKHGIPRLNQLSAASKNQIMLAARKPSGSAIRTPSGDFLPAHYLMTLAFELLGLPMRVRQEVSRLMLIALATLHGHRPEPDAVKRHIGADAMRIFFRAVSQYAEISDGPAGIFAVEPSGQPTTVWQSVLPKGSSMA